MVVGPQASQKRLAKPSCAGGVRAIIVMGPSGCGKSTLAKALAQALGWHFIEGDDHHPPQNIAKMQAGEPLTDEDRLPFLANVGRELKKFAPAVASCSALRKAHRDILRGLVGDIMFVFPEVDEDELARRVQDRDGHFLPSSLLASQLAALQPPLKEEYSILLDGSAPTAAQVETVLQYFSPL